MKRPFKYHSPLILRFGFLHSYKLTMAVALIEFIITTVCVTMAGVLIDALSDPWTYMWFPIWYFGTRIIRQIIAGYDELFDIFTPEFESQVKLYTSFDTPPSDTQRKIRSLFIDSDSYDAFREDIRSRLFGKGEFVFLGLLFLGNIAMAYLYITVYDPVHVYGLYGSFVEPYTSVLIYWNMLLISVIGYFIISALWMVVVMIMGISFIDKHRADLKITRYIRDISQSKTPDPDSSMGYETFYSLTTPIGQYLYNVTFKVMLFIVGLAVYSLTMNALRGINIGLYGTVFTLACVAISLILFITPQIVLHNVLAKTKNDMRDALIIRRDELNIEMLEITAKEPSSDSRSTMDQIYLTKTMLDRIEYLVDNIEQGNTWSFRMPTALKLIATSMTPLVVTVAQYIFEHSISP